MFIPGKGIHRACISLNLFRFIFSIVFFCFENRRKLQAENRELEVLLFVWPHVCFAWIKLLWWITNIFTCLVESKPDKQEVSLTKRVSVLCWKLYFAWRDKKSLLSKQPVFSDKHHCLCSSTYFLLFNNSNFWMNKCLKYWKWN